MGSFVCFVSETDRPVIIYVKIELLGCVAHEYRCHFGF